MNEIKIDPNVARIIQNGLEGAIMGMGRGFGGTQVSQTDTIFENLRFYMVSNMRQPLSQAYVEIGLVKTVVDVPVEDAFRGGVTFKSKQLSPEEIEKLHAFMDQQDIVNSVMGEAFKWNRLFGGAGILIITDQDHETPFDPELVDESTPLEFRALDMWELFYDKQNVEGFNPALQEPEFDFYNYYGKKIHKSYVMKLKGITAPSFIRPRLRGWGVSIVEVLVRSINQYLKSNNVAFELLDEAKVDFYQLEGFFGLLGSAEGERQVTKRMMLMNYQKNFQNAVMLDSKDKWEQKVMNFTGLADMMREIRVQVASDLRMPLSKIFGISATGLNSGQEDTENYNAMVESDVRAKAKYDFIRIARVCCMKLFGYAPDDLAVEYKPLRVLSGTDEEIVKSAKFDRLLRAKQAGEMTTKEFKDACNKAQLLEIQIDSDVETIAPEPIKGSGEGANKEPKQKMGEK